MPMTNLSKYKQDRFNEELEEKFEDSEAQLKNRRSILKFSLASVALGVVALMGKTGLPITSSEATDTPTLPVIWVDPTNPSRYLVLNITNQLTKVLTREDVSVNQTAGQDLLTLTDQNGLQSLRLILVIAD
jgi:hypothetical protein